jgi:hypothetical protein
MTEAILAAGGVLFRHQSDPGRQITARLEGMRIRNRGDQCRRNQGANAGDIVEALADLG